jgi:methylated-DNA-[protein]-cysteine S-methyltransferase
MSIATLSSPIGLLCVEERDHAISRIGWTDASVGAPPTPLLAEAVRQLAAYFDGRLKTFDLPLDAGGDALQRAVWDGMLAIPYGETRTYGALAKEIGSNARLVGGACGRNPIPIVIPCHRIVGADGKMVGYSGGGGVETKQVLLTLEGALLI